MALWLTLLADEQQVRNIYFSVPARIVSFIRRQKHDEKTLQSISESVKWMRWCLFLTVPLFLTIYAFDIVFGRIASLSSAFPENCISVLKYQQICSALDLSMEYLIEATILLTWSSLIFIFISAIYQVVKNSYEKIYELRQEKMVESETDLYHAGNKYRKKLVATTIALNKERAKK